MAKIVTRTPTGRQVKVGLYDYRSYWLYDRETINNGATEVYFFQSPEGKTTADTNLKQFSTIQTGWQFEIHALRVILPPDISTADAEALFANSAITLYKDGDTEVFSAPALMFNAGCGLYGATTETSTNIISNGIPSSNAVTKIPVPILIKGGETFNIRLMFNPAVSLSVASIKLWMVLDGILRRPVKGT